MGSYASAPTVLGTCRIVIVSLHLVKGRRKLSALSHTHGRTHARSQNSTLDVLAFGRCGLSTQNRIHQRTVVLKQGVLLEGCLADRSMDDVCFVQTILHFTGLEIVNCLSDIGSNSTGFRVRHKALRT